MASTQTEVWFMKMTVLSSERLLPSTSSIAVFLISTMFLAIAVCAESPVPTPAGPGHQSRPYLLPVKDTYLKFAEQTETTLRRDVLGVWFPRSIDNENGGFHSNFTRDWKPAKSEGKFSVFQGRMVWMAAQIVMQRPDLKDQYLPVVAQGVDFLANVMWDRQYGGFFWGLDDRGHITPDYTDGKDLYGISFCLYGAAAAYQATNDPRALELAKQSFRWMDEHGHDAKNGGYFEWLTREGKPVQSSAPSGRIDTTPVAAFLMGYKSMNTHIHLLESVAQLYEVWKDETVRNRLQELLSIVRDRICVEPGVMNLYFTNEWRAIPDHDSYGHDVETAYLMLESADLLGQSGDPKTEHMARKLVDHALAYGWDETNGGFYREGTTIGAPEDMKKEWWVQMEGLNALLLMHDMYGAETDVYFRAFQKQWQFIRDRQVDHEFGGIYDTVERDGTVTNYIKARMWKEAYHDGRALLNVTARLLKLAASAPN
jgi:mannobiose 2-epimerase